MPEVMPAQRLELCPLYGLLEGRTGRITDGRLWLLEYANSGGCNFRQR